MYRPNFCAECGEQIVRAEWYFWTSRRFCKDCGRRLRKTRVKLPLIAGAVVFSLGLVAGRSIRPKPPAMILTQGQTTGPASKPADPNGRSNKPQDSDSGFGPDGSSTERPTDPNEVVSICGARTKKGTPCSRRVRGTGRCWQHKGMQAMLPPEKLTVAAG